MKHGAQWMSGDVEVKQRWRKLEGGGPGVKMVCNAFDKKTESSSTIFAVHYDS